MYINRNTPQEYPFTGTFYTTAVDESLPLIEQVENRVDILTTECDITEASHSYSSNFISAKYAVYLPFDIEDDIPIYTGLNFEANMYGVNVNGKVIGIFPSQLEGVTVYIEDIDA